MFVKVKNWLREFRLSLRLKIVLALSAIAVVLLMSGLISFLEYRHMSNYVSKLLAGNVNNIHRTQEMVDAVDAYNLDILAVIGDDRLTHVPEFDRAAFLSTCEALKGSLAEDNVKELADSVVYAYSAYMLASMELEEVYESSFINTRDWYFNRLQPIFGRLRTYLDHLSSEMYEDLEENTETFDISGLRYYCTVHDCGKIVGYVKPDPSNVHDARAQAVIRSDGKLLGYIPRTQLDWYEDFNEQNVVCPFVGEIELDRSSARLIAEIKVIIPTSKEYVEEEIENQVFPVCYFLKRFLKS